MGTDKQINITIKELEVHGDKCQIVKGKGWTLILWDENIMFPSNEEKDGSDDY